MANGKYEVTVSVDLSDAYGHAFIGLSDPAGNGPISGFYPSQPFTSTSSGWATSAPGFVRNDDDHRSESDRDADLR